MIWKSFVFLLFKFKKRPNISWIWVVILVCIIFTFCLFKYYVCAFFCIGSSCHQGKFLCVNISGNKDLFCILILNCFHFSFSGLCSSVLSAAVTPPCSSVYRGFAECLVTLGDSVSSKDDNPQDINSICKWATFTHTYTLHGIQHFYLITLHFSHLQVMGCFPGVCEWCLVGLPRWCSGNLGIFESRVPENSICG